MAKTNAPARKAAPRTVPAKAVRRGERTETAVPARPPPMIAHEGEAGLGWVDAERGYRLALDGGKLAAMNAKGKRLAAVPKELRGGEVAARLEALRDWLIEHERACGATVERWMLRSLPVPRAVLQAVWEDIAWRRPLENAVIAAVDGDDGDGAGRFDPARTGLFRGVDPERGVGIVDLEGETAWLDDDRIAVPHPVLLPELDAWRELAMQLGLAQGVSQLYRETYAKPAGAAGTVVDRFEDGRFAMLLHAAGRARSLGYQVRGGFATCRVWERGAAGEARGAREARYWLGADDAYAEAYTGALSWVDEHDRGLALAEVGPVAFSEGMRMASAIYAGRIVGAEEGP
jgi:hypothetical protein